MRYAGKHVLWRLAGAALVIAAAGALAAAREPVTAFFEPWYWGEHRGYAVAAVVIGLQVLLIGGLLVQRARRRRAESALVESEEVHRLTLGNISDAVFITKSNGDFTFICPNVHVIFGHSHPEVEQLGNIRLLLGDGIFDPAALEASGEVSNIDRRILDKGGREHDLLVNVKRIVVRQGTTLYTCRDVTDRRRAEEATRELAHVSRLAVVGELTASIAHEINQPLGAILSNADAAEMLLESGPARLGEVRQILEDIRKDDLRASEVVRRIRGLVQKHEPEIQPYDLNEAVNDCVRMVSRDARRRGVAIETKRADLPILHGDSVQVQQVLLNLMLNGMDAMASVPESARLLSIRTAHGQAGVAEVTVTDTGPGIPAASLARVFEPFYTTKQGGMGLGLSIARTLVEAQGGRIRAESSEAGGAAFRFELPLGRRRRGS